MFTFKKKAQIDLGMTVRSGVVVGTTFPFAPTQGPIQAQTLPVPQATAFDNAITSQSWPGQRGLWGGVDPGFGFL